MEEENKDYNVDSKRFTATCPNCNCGLMIYLNYYKEIELNILKEMIDDK